MINIMKKFVSVLVGIISLAVIPVGMAAALEIEGGSDANVHVGSGIHSNVELGATVSDENKSDNGSDEEREVGKAHASSTVQWHGKSQEHASSTKGHEDGDKGDNASSSDHGKGWGKGGIIGFFRMIFNLPDSTTVGQIKAKLAATTTADAHGEGLGLWARIMGLFHVGN